ncbi:hypothetical protein EON63_13880 [archaeon]|nr:MAG: hypothetical protein EON63_13880 [archaeon]
MRGGGVIYNSFEVETSSTTPTPTTSLTGQLSRCIHLGKLELQKSVEALTININNAEILIVIKGLELYWQLTVLDICGLFWI